jgi:hypothetical protein
MIGPFRFGVSIRDRHERAGKGRRGQERKPARFRLRALGARDAATATASTAAGENQGTVHADESIGAESARSTVTKRPGWRFPAGAILE